LKILLEGIISGELSDKGDTVSSLIMNAANRDYSLKKGLVDQYRCGKDRKRILEKTKKARPFSDPAFNINLI